MEEVEERLQEACSRVEETETRQSGVEERLESVAASLEEVRGGMFGKKEVCEMINRSLHEVEERVSSIVQSTLESHAEAYDKQCHQLRTSIMSEIQLMNTQSKSSSKEYSSNRINDMISLSVEERMKKHEGLYKECMKIVEGVKEELLEGISGAEERAFVLNSQVVDGIVGKIKDIEKELKSLNGSFGKLNDDRLGSSHVRDIVREGLKEQLELIQDEISNNMKSFSVTINNMNKRVEMFDSKFTKFEDKISALERVKPSGIKDTSITNNQINKNSVLSYFLSPDDMNSNRSNNQNQPEIQNGKKSYIFDKKKVPTINLNNLESINNCPADMNKPSSNKMSAEKQNQNDSYTSFEEEFKFRLDRTKTHKELTSNENNNNEMMNDVKLSYVFSSTSKDNNNMDYEILSKRLFNDNSKSGVHRDTGEKKRDNNNSKNTLYNISNEYSNILHNTSHQSNQSYNSMSIPIIPSSSQNDPSRGNGNKKKSGGVVQVVMVDDESNKENVNNVSNSIRVINDSGDGFDFEKWAKENDLEIGPFNFKHNNGLN